MADLEVPLRNRQGAAVGTIPVSAASLGGKVRPRLIHRAVVYYGRNLRIGTASTKTRGEVNRSNRKPWPQKGTGRARAGTRRSPLWRGGGIIFGPKPRDYSVDINRKQRRLAAKSALLWKIRDGEVIAVDDLDLPEPKTKRMVEILRQLGIQDSCLIGLAEVPRNVLLACRNLPRVKVAPINEFNAYDLVRHKFVLVTKAALEAFLGPKEAEPEQGSPKEEVSAPEVTPEAREEDTPAGEEPGSGGEPEGGEEG